MPEEQNKAPEQLGSILPVGDWWELYWKGDLIGAYGSEGIAQRELDRLMGVETPAQLKKVAEQIREVDAKRNEEEPADSETKPVAAWDANRERVESLAEIVERLQKDMVIQVEMTKKLLEENEELRGAAKQHTADIKELWGQLNNYSEYLSDQYNRLGRLDEWYDAHLAKAAAVIQGDKVMLNHMEAYVKKHNVDSANSQGITEEA